MAGERGGDQIENRATNITATPASPKRGRKPTGFDKKAYDREKARERRAAKKGKP